MEFNINWEEVAAVVVPIVTAGFFIVRHIWISTKKIDTLTLRTDSLDKLAHEGQKDHVKIFEKIGRMDKSIASIEAKVDMLLNK